MNKATGHDLIKIGILPSRGFSEALAHANKMLASGVGWEAVKMDVLGKYGQRQEQKAKLRETPLSIDVASKPQTEEEDANLELSLNKIRELSLVPVIERAALMPDNCPSGQEWGSIPVGGAIITSNSVIPAAHSADVNCGMCATFFECASDIQKLMEALRCSTSFGPFPAPMGLEAFHPVLEENVWGNPFLKDLSITASKYLGTQGDGNHFSYIGEINVTRSLVKSLGDSGHDDVCGALQAFTGETLRVLVTHHGSRNFGAQVYKRGLDIAVKETAKVAEGIPKSGAWLDLGTPEGGKYWEALEYVGRWTSANHEVIHSRFLAAAGAKMVTRIANHHNAVWKHEGKIYHGKGATPAWRDDGLGRLGIIPLNMGREILIVEGLDNRQFLSFAPHGAGRNRSRSAVKREFEDPETRKLDEKKVAEAIKKQTKGLQILWHSGSPDISESPMGYKSPEVVKRELELFGLAKIIGEVSPRGCMMAGEITPPWKILKKGSIAKEKSPEKKPCSKEK